MRRGQEVSYIAADNKRQVATISAVAGHGPSLSKRLDLTIRKDGEDVVVEDVPHEVDAEQGEAFWLLKGERRVRSTEDEPVELKEPVVDTVAFPEVTETAPPKATPRSARR